MGKLIIPKTYIEKLEAPLIFLAGPIKGAPNWQDEAVKIIFSQEQNLIIASPKKELRNKIQYAMSGNEEYFPRQRAWERYYMDIASKTGAILFWLPGEKEHNCKKVYSAMTRLELGQWMTNYKYNKKVGFCIGSDGNFPEINRIEYDLQLDSPDKKVMKTLEETCSEAVRIARKKFNGD